MRYDVLKESIISKEVKQSTNVLQAIKQLDLHLNCSNTETMVTSLQYDIHSKLKISRLVYDKVRNSR